MTPRETVLALNPSLVCQALRLPSTGEIYGYVIVNRERKTFGGGRTPAAAWADAAPDSDQQLEAGTK